MSWFSFLKKDKPEAVPELTDVVQQGDAPKAKSRSRSKSKDDQSDPALPEKKRARRRLVGAVVMTLALVVVLPMILDAQPQFVSRDIRIQVHAKNKLSQPDDAKAVSAESASTDEKPAEAPSASKNASETAKEKLPAQATSEAQSKPAIKTVVQDAPKTEIKAQPETPAKSAEAKKTATTPKNHFMIQVAALSSMDSVKELRVRLAIAGFKSHIEKVKTTNGQRIRVRVGPYTSRKEAEKACPKLSTMKLRCLLVTS